MTVLHELLGNKVLWTGITGWFAAQLLKTIWLLMKEKKWHFSRLVGSGGMPSSHSSIAAALSVAVGRTSGFDSLLFAIAMCFSLVVMYDACGVRYEAGKHAQILNRMYPDGQEKPLKELLGHTVPEVLAGALLGIIIGSIVPIS